VDTSTHAKGVNGRVGTKGLGFLLYGERVERNSKGDLGVTVGPFSLMRA